MLRLSGKEVSTFRRDRLAKGIKKWVDAGHPTPGLAVVLVGDDPASHVYVNHKEKACQALGINSWIHRLPESTNSDELKSLIDKLNSDNGVHGILVQLPLPQHIDKDQALKWVGLKKDADGLSTESLGLMLVGKTKVVSCTPNGVMAMLEYYKIDPAGKRAVVVGRSQIVGLPMANLLQQANATVTVCHSKTPDVAVHTREADIVVVAAGQPRLFGKDDFKKGSVVIDVGVHRKDDGKLCGDVRYEELEGWCEAASPVPGGVGPMTITMLLENTCRLAGIEF